MARLNQDKNFILYNDSVFNIGDTLFSNVLFPGVVHQGDKMLSVTKNDSIDVKYIINSLKNTHNYLHILFKYKDIDGEELKTKETYYLRVDPKSNEISFIKEKAIIE